MPITCDKNAGVYRIDTPSSSLIFVVRDLYLFQPYWGPKCGNLPPASYARVLDLIPRASFSPPVPGCEWSPDAAPLALPVAGSGDSRHSALHIRYADGTTSSRLRFIGAEITETLHCPRDENLVDLPHISALSGEKACTLILHLADTFREISADISYSILENHDALFTSVKITNQGSAPCAIETAASACMHFPASAWDQITLSGAWARERQVDRVPVMRGTRTVGSSRGISGHVFNPFTAILEKGADERTGAVYGFSLVYSGDFTLTAERDQYDALRVSASCGSRDFAWNLESGASFETPQAVLVYSGRGIGEMSRTYHRLYRDNLCVSAWKGKRRPVLMNNWEATYFSFTGEKLASLIRAAEGTGIELFVLDDGWFGKRDSDRSSLGDWVPHEAKLPAGLAGLSSSVSASGMKFGLWIEPEMVSPDSGLFRAHPSWCVHITGLQPQESRFQLVLDLSRAEVCAHIVDVISAVLSSADISYVKWDFNRVLTDFGSPSLPAHRQGEFSHRFTLGSWRVMRELTSRFPKILFEGCAGGGARFDPGTLHFMSQIWTSDDTDARERLAIHWGTSLVYPFSSMAAHVSAVPNHQCGRTTPFAFRCAAALTGATGFELDLSALSESERLGMTGWIASWKKWEHLIREGNLYRLRSPFDGDETAWIFVSDDRDEALLCHYLERNRPNPPLKRLALNGLDGAKMYRVEDFQMSAESLPLSQFPEKGSLYCGADLAGPGIPLPLAGIDCC